MLLNVFTDPHLGTSRKANTTAASSARLNDALFVAAMACKTTGPTFIAGDLFDKSHNNERVITQGIKVAEGCTVLAGNHDETNTEGDVTSLQIVAEALLDTVIKAPKVGGAHWVQPYPGVYAVPHHASQEMFMQALQQASEDAALHCETPNKYLFVHCNRGIFVGDTPDSTLVITDEDESTLLETFTKIFYGHEHRPATYKDGRVVVLGNTHPTGFADISNKYRYVLDTAAGEVEQHLIWSEAEHFASLELGSPLPANDALQFIEVHGAGTRQEVSKYVSTIWDTYPTAFAVRSMCQYTDDVKVDDAAVDFHDIPAIIENDLKGTDLLPLMQELRGSIA